MTINELHAAYQAADDAYQAALVAHYGKRAAGDARYMHPAEQPAHIAGLNCAMRSAHDKWHKAAVVARLAA
jgi:hypothetical protein